MKRLLLSVLFIATTALHAHPAVMTTIEGSEVSLYSKGHSFAGKIKDKLVSGRKLPGKFESTLTIIDNDVAQTTDFSQSEGVILAGGQAKITKFDRDSNAFTLYVGEKEYTAVITYEDFSDGHFINPTYSIIDDGQIHSFTIKNGAACLGYSAHLIIMIFGALLS